MNKLCTISLIFIFLLTGCTTVRIALDHDAAKSINKTAAVLGISQQEIKTEIEQSNAGATGGLIGAIIDSIIDHQRNKKVEKRVVSIRDSMLDYSVPDKLKLDIKAELRNINISANPKIVVANDYTRDQVKDILKKQKEDAVLILDAGYSMSPQFKIAKIHVTATLYANSEATKAATTKTHLKLPVLYHNLLLANTALGEEEASNKLERAALWVENKGKRIKDAFDNNSLQIASMLVYDINQGSLENDVEGTKRVRVMLNSGIEVKTVSTYVWIRPSNNTLIAITDDR